MRIRRVVFLVAALLLAVGCGGDEGGQTQETPKVGKGDCPDCDPAGPSAFEQADMGLRFYVPGDRWQVAWQFKQRNDMVREALLPEQLPDDPTELPLLQEDKRVTVTQPYLFAYEVLGVDNRRLDNVMRDVARIEVTQEITNSGMFAQQRLDRHEYKLEFELDDLLRPVRETFFNRQYPHGKTVELEQVSALSGLENGANLFPHAVPRVLTAGEESPAPMLTPELEAIADDRVPGWRDASYRKYQFANGDLVFWAAGQLWPFFVDCQQGYGLLVGQILTER